MKNEVYKKRMESCLEAVLSYETFLKSNIDDVSLREEFSIVHGFLENIESIELSEEDIARIESSTAKLFSELESIQKTLNSTLRTPEEK